MYIRSSLGKITHNCRPVCQAVKVLAADIFASLLPTYGFVRAPSCLYLAPDAPTDSTAVGATQLLGLRGIGKEHHAAERPASPEGSPEEPLSVCFLSADASGADARGGGDLG